MPEDDVTRSLQIDPDIGALLQRHGIDTEGDQQTKTRATLRFFTTGVGID